MRFCASDTYYNTTIYNRSGKRGLKRPAIMLGLWHNLGFVDVFENSRAMIRSSYVK